MQLREIATPDQWKTLFAAQSGYLLDAMDILLYVFALNTLKHEFGLTNRMDQYFAGSGNRYVTNTAPDGSRSISYYQYGQLKLGNGKQVISRIWTIILYVLKPAG